MLSIREINRLCLTGKPVVAQYYTTTGLGQARIIRARRANGQLQGKLLGSGQWVTLRAVWPA